MQSVYLLDVSASIIPRRVRRGLLPRRGNGEESNREPRGTIDTIDEHIDALSSATVFCSNREKR
jgi:hypothetical protein